MSWFDTITDSQTLDGLTLNIAICSNILENTETDPPAKNAIKHQFAALIRNITGTTFNVITTRVSQEKFYDAWAGSNSFNTELLLMLNAVQIKQTDDFGRFYSNMDSIVDFILVRYFANPIPQGSWKGTGDPDRPLIVDNQDVHHTEVLDSLYSFLYNGSTGLKGLGSNTLANMCNSFTRDQISANPLVRRWCGCFGPDDPIAIHAKEKYPDQTSYTKACDPLCVHLSSIKIFDPDNSYNVEPCNSQLCILTKVSITTSDYNGTVKMNQTCPCSKENTPCFCIIDSTVEDLLNKTSSPDGNSMSMPVTFKQYCPGARCMVEEPDGTLVEVECQNDNPNHTNTLHGIKSSLAKKRRVNADIFFVLGLFGIAAILFILCARHIEFEPKFKVNNIVKQSNNISKYTSTFELGYLNR